METKQIKTSRIKAGYTKKTICRSLTYNSIYINPRRLTSGNTKLYKILIFDLPAGKSCLNCSSCASRCYAKKAEVQYPETKMFRATNFHLVKNNLKFLKSILVEQLSKTSIPTVRIHASGDFYSQEYIDMWDSIISSFPAINFYAYTKVDKILNFEVITENKNFNLIPSLINDKVLNFGSIEYCEELKEKYGSFICPVTNGYHDIMCGKGCDYCITNKNVCFVEH